MKNLYKKFISFTSVICVLLSLPAQAIPTVIPDAPQIAAKGYILMDFDSGEIIAAKGAHTRLAPASLTKMMTSYVIGQEIKRGKISLDDDVKVSENAWSVKFPGSSKMFIEVGDIVKVRDLNRGIIIQSGNDACVAMSEYIAGSTGAFVDLMNAWAKSIGMKDTHYTNVHGLDSRNLYSTPYDLALLAHAIIRDVPNEYRIYGEKEFTYNNITQKNRNELLWDKTMHVDGMKTGHTDNAGYSLVSSATQGKMRLIAVVMGTKSSKARRVESKKLLNYGFRFFETLSMHTAEETVISQRVWMGDVNTVKLGVKKDTYVTIPRGLATDLTANFVLEKDLKAPIKKGEAVGKIFYQLKGKDVADYPLVALNDVKEGGFLSRLWDSILVFFMNLFN